MNIKNNKNCNISINDKKIEEKPAKEMFEELGFEYQECYFQNELDSIIYKNTKTRATQVEFILHRKLYKVFFETFDDGYNMLPSAVDMELHKAINKQIEELNWK